MLALERMHENERAVLPPMAFTAHTHIWTYPASTL